MSYRESDDAAGFLRDHGVTRWARGGHNPSPVRCGAAAADGGDVVACEFCQEHGACARSSFPLACVRCTALDLYLATDRHTQQRRKKRFVNQLYNQ